MALPSRFRPAFSKKALGWLAVLGFTVGGVAITTTPAWSAEPQACGVSANAPFQEFGFVKGVVNRGGCGDFVNLQSWLFADITFWPDPNIGFGSANLVNGSATGAGPCDREGRENYYNQARTDTGQRSGESQRRLLC